MTHLETNEMDRIRVDLRSAAPDTPEPAPVAPAPAPCDLCHRWTTDGSTLCIRHRRMK